VADHVLVIGAGLAGISTCGALRAAGHDGRLTLIGAEPGPPYDRPPLSKSFLTAHADDTSIALQPPSWYAEQGIDLRTGMPVAEIDAESGRVQLADGTGLTADVLVLATGGTARRIPGIPHEHAGVHLLRTREDAVRLRAALGPGTRLLVIGAGLIGAEVTASATAIGCHVTLVDPNASPLAAVIGPHAAEALRLQHLRHGARLVHGTCTALEPAGANGPLRATLSTGEAIGVDQILVGIGIRPDTTLAARAGLAVDNGILVDELQRTASPRVYAVGDAARTLGPHGPLPRTEHWDNARRTAELAARAILGLTPPPPKAPWFWTDRYGTHLEMTGHYDPLAQEIIRQDLAGENGGTVVYHRDGQCIGAVTLDRPLDIRAVQRIIDRGRRPTAAQLADPAVDLRDLAR
jgi:3-phenylpropionate/trans-cinnamate dioxygenase ferredoxin reductase component